MNLLILGGSGQLSGRVSELALGQGHAVWAVTRGIRPLPDGVHGVTADRNDPQALRAALASCGVRWDAAIDCICRTPDHARIDLDILPAFTDRLAVVSTDSVYHPAHKRVPQTEEPAEYMHDGGYGDLKRQMELVFLACPDLLKTTIFRPGHIFGPGFLPGCYPEQSRQADLLAHIRADKPLRLVGGGDFLIHPIYVDDMALALLDCLHNPTAHGEVYCIGGPDVITNAAYYVCLGELTGHSVQIESVPLEGYLEAHPQYSGHLCHRCYDLSKLASAGIRMPDMPLREGLRRQVEWLDTQIHA